MVESEVLTRQFSESPQALWPRLVDALRTVPGITLRVSDDVLRTAEFVTGMTSTSWGENMYARIEPSGGDGATLRITGQVRHTFLTTGFGERIHRRGVVRNLLRHLDR